MRSLHRVHPKFLFVVLPGLVCVATGVQAVGLERFDVGAFVGARYAGSASLVVGGESLNPEPVDLTFDPNVSFGAMGDIMVYDVGGGRVFLDLAFSYQKTKLKADTATEKDVFVDDISTIYYHGGVGYQWHIVRWKPYAVFTLGATQLSPSSSDIKSSTDFSYAFGGGIKYQAGALWGARLDARWYATPRDLGKTDAICGYYSCFPGENKTTVWQGDVTLGGYFSF